jgi:hypothetical protein
MSFAEVSALNSSSSNTANRAASEKSLSSHHHRRTNTLKSSATVDTLDELMYNSKQPTTNRSSSSAAENFVFTQELCIVSVLDPVKNVHVNLDEAIRGRLFDIATRMYYSPVSNAKLTLVEAIEQNVIKIKNTADFHVSYELVVDDVDKRTGQSFAKVVSIRFVVDSFTSDVVPLNVAVARSLVRIDAATNTATLVGSGGRVISLKKAYAQKRAFTQADVDENARGVDFRVYLARKASTGKVMSSRSALAKSWVSVDKRLYIDRTNDEELKFSQAIDMDLLILRVVDESEQDNSPQLDERKDVRVRAVAAAVNSAAVSSHGPLIRSKSSNVMLGSRA